MTTRSEAVNHMEREISIDCQDENQLDPPVRLQKALVTTPRGKTLSNAVARFGAQIAAIAINLLSTPYIIRHLGVESFGIIAVINTMVSYMAIATTSLTSTVGRNLTFAIERQDQEKADKEVSTAVFGLLAIFLVLFLPLSALCLYIDRLIVIPQELLHGARLLFLLTVISFGLTTVSGPIGAAMFVRNRLDIFSMVSLCRTVVFVCGIVGLFWACGASLATYGLALAGASLVLLLLHTRIHRYLLPTIHISPRWFDRRVLRDIVSLGGWMTVAQIGGLLFLQTDLLVANRVLGAAAAGQLAAVSVVSLQLRSLSSLVSGLFAPDQAALAARDDAATFSVYLLRSIRLTTLFVALLVGVYCGHAREVLSIWLGAQFAALAPLTIVLTSYLVITLGTMPCWNAVLAVGKVKVPAIVTLVMGAANVCLAIILASYFGLMGVAISGCIMLTLRNTMFTPWYVARACGISFAGFLLELAVGCAYAGGIYGISACVNRLLKPHSMPMLIASIGVSLALGAMVLTPTLLRARKKSAMYPSVHPRSAAAPR